MERSPRLLKPSPRTKGFSLVEVLVALSLVAVLGTTALLLLESARRVSREVATESEDPLAPLLPPLRGELDHLLPAPPLKTLPAFTLEEEGRRLHFTTRLPDALGRLRAAEITYVATPEGAFRVQRIAHHPHSVTNRLDTAGLPLRFQVRHQDTWTEQWPPEERDASGPPLLLRLSLSETHKEPSHTLFIPPALRVDGQKKEDASPDASPDASANPPPSNR